MINKFKFSLAVLAVAAGLLAPISALAAAQLSYTTTLQPTGPSMTLGDYYGTLTLRVASDGIVQGWYKPQYGDFTPVQGSLQNGSYWLQIGNQGSFQINATEQKDGTLKGTATNLGFSRGDYPPTFSFVAKLTPN